VEGRRGSLLSPGNLDNACHWRDDVNP